MVLTPPTFSVIPQAQVESDSPTHMSLGLLAMAGAPEGV